MQVAVYHGQRDVCVEAVEERRPRGGDLRRGHGKVIIEP
jgi:hypothetical protein